VVIQDLSQLLSAACVRLGLTGQGQVSFLPRLLAVCALNGDAGATGKVECSLCAAGTFLTGSGVYAYETRKNSASKLI
jgi:hypothetical protein